MLNTKPVIVHEECPICEHQPIHEKTRMAMVKVPTGNAYDDIPYKEFYFECPHCKTRFMSGSMMDQNLATARFEYQAHATIKNPPQEIISEKLLRERQADPQGITTEIGLKNGIAAFFKHRDLVIIRTSATGKTEAKRVHNWRKKSASEINHILNAQEWN